MATGRSNMLIKQLGEYLVASELARRGLIVATFSGNIPDFDIIATDLKGSSCPIQVKTIRGGSWQFSIDKFAEIKFDGKMQIIGDRKNQNVPNLICIFVISSEIYGADQFFILEWSRVQDIVISNHAHWLNLHNGVRPKKFDSLHCAITASDLLPYKDNWSIIAERL